MPFQLKITGHVSVELTQLERMEDNSWSILIMGPTGSGKSTFIEALAGDNQSLGISKDQLSGFTQDVAAYQFKNALRSNVPGPGYAMPVYLIDTPGFSDAKMSEMEIITKVKTWITDRGIGYIDHIFYLCPITDTRVPGSKRRTIKMMSALLRPGSAYHVTIVTTMWDRVSNSGAKERAEGHFVQLRDDVWKALIDKRAQIEIFTNTQDSALGITRNAVERSFFSLPIDRSTIKPTHPSALLLYQELVDRINNARQEKVYLHQERTQLITKPDVLLESVVIPRYGEVKDDLDKFLGQLGVFGAAPPEFEGVLQRLAYQNLLDNVNETRDVQKALQCALSLVQIDTNHEGEAALHAQIQEADLNLVDYMTSLLEYGLPPEGFEKALEDTIRPPESSSPATRTLFLAEPVNTVTSSSAHPTSSTTIPPDSSRIVDPAPTTPSSSMASSSATKRRFMQGFKFLKAKLML